MKKYLSLLLLFLFFSCSMPTINYEWYKLDKAPNELNNSNSGYKVVGWVIDNIHYKSYANGFKPAQMTLDSKQGNCANMALLELAIWYKLTRQKGQLIFCNQKDGLHYCARINNNIYEDCILDIYEVVEWDEIAEYIYYRQ